jgi:hypothetical protein
MSRRPVDYGFASRWRTRTRYVVPPWCLRRDPESIRDSSRSKTRDPGPSQASIMKCTNAEACMTFLGRIVNVTAARCDSRAGARELKLAGTGSLLGPSLD